MPPKGRAPHKAKEATGKSSAQAPPPAKAQPPAPPPPPQTVRERSLQRCHLARPFLPAIEASGLSALSPAERAVWASAQYLGGASSTKTAKPTAAPRHTLSSRTQKDLWRHVNEVSLPLRAVSQSCLETEEAPTTTTTTTTTPPNDGTVRSCSVWGRDRSGRDIGEYTPDAFYARTLRRAQLTALEAAHCAFEARRAAAEDYAAGEHEDEDEGEGEDETERTAERQRRADMAALRTELYGQQPGGSYAQDPAWDDVTPIALAEPEGALAAIAYPEDYAEAISYLRAVMTTPEYSARCLRLTEHVISLNPAHYTVWLYRFSVVSALRVPVADELAWLNSVALQNLKNYQIWHHRYLLVEYAFPDAAAANGAGAGDSAGDGDGDGDGDRADRMAAFARSEMAFLTDILAEDTKNYHVWSYRQYLVRKLGLWTDDERQATEAFVRQDVRNNSAWSHRFFLVFSDPAVAAAVPAAVADREVAYAQARIQEAPQNESPWNYLRGVLAKSGRPLASVEAFAAQFVANIGAEDDGGGGGQEEVRSTHALDVLAAIGQEQGDTARADVYLRRLAEKWDPIRAGYWQYRRAELAA